MVTVAKNFDAPIKFLFPKNIFAATYQFSMLGLGDIVIPGVFVALMLRFDRKRNFPNLDATNLITKGFSSFSKTYFFRTLIAYTLGLITTIGVMHLFKAAQPALLYLVPFCLLSSFFTAVFRGEISLLISYTEEEKKKND
jgi:minor histocompatibility antigen H13